LCVRARRRGGAAGAAAGGQQQPAAQGGLSTVINTLLRYALIWWVMSYFRAGQPGSSGSSATPGSMSAPLFRRGEPVDMYVYLSESPEMRLADRADAALIWHVPELSLAVSPERTASYNYTPSEV
jgi:hypothetical protein